MRTKVLPLSISLLALLASAAVTAGHANRAEIDVDIVDQRGRAFDEFPVRDGSRDDVLRAYVEAVPNASYGVRVRNRSSQRIGVVIAVDGRNIISGKKSNLSARERMYVLSPYQSATYTGWRTGRDQVNGFYFTQSDDSYAGAFGDYTAMGVVAVAAFRERNGSWERYENYDRYDPYDGRGKSGNDNTAASPSLDGDGKSSRRRNSAPLEKHGSASEPGTGFGDERYSPSVRVSFEAESRASNKVFLKYEWRDTLCEIGVLDCQRRNRFWPEQRHGYAPYPPGYPSWSRSRY